MSSSRTPPKLPQPQPIRLRQDLVHRHRNGWSRLLQHSARPTVPWRLRVRHLAASGHKHRGGRGTSGGHLRVQVRRVRDSLIPVQRAGQAGRNPSQLYALPSLIHGPKLALYCIAFLVGNYMKKEDLSETIYTASGNDQVLSARGGRMISHPKKKPPKVKMRPLPNYRRPLHHDGVRRDVPVGMHDRL